MSNVRPHNPIHPPEESPMIDTASVVLAEALVKFVKKSFSEVKVTGNDGGLPALRDEEIRQEIAMRMAERQAKVAQEIAIARKIELAHEVEIEEFYDASAEGTLGAKTDGTSLSLGAGAKANRVVRRVYKFRGTTTATEQVSANKVLVAEQPADAQ
jgi:hypothetical protein